MTPDELKQDANGRLLKLDLSNNKNQPAMKLIAADLGIITESNKADDLRKLLTPVKESLLPETKSDVNVDEIKPEPKVEVKVDNYVMKVTHLSWGSNNKNHFYADKKPLINAKVMGKYADVLKIWLKNEWIEKGSYKK